jgi:hypothetical protein
LAKFLLIPLASNPGFGADILGFVGKGAATLARQLGGEMLGLFFFFLLSLVLWDAHYKWEL